MAKLATITLFLTFFIVLVLMLSYQVTSDDHDDHDNNEVEDEREFNYEDDSERGPARWGEIRKEWSMCRNGSMQSPIDLLHDRVELVSNLGTLEGSYRPCNATLKNRGHDMMLKWEANAGFIRLNGTLYELKQCHWHSSSEHTINGKKFDLELHVVHESVTGKIAVTGILYKIGEPDPFLTSMMHHLEELSGTSEKQEVIGMVDPKKIRTNSTNYYRYIGSLTVPPCTQNVLWTILEEVRTVSREQVKNLRVAVHDESETNARPLQPKNRRVVQHYKPANEEDD